jgi:hypothetical protein
VLLGVGEIEKFRVVIEVILVAVGIMLVAVGAVNLFLAHGLWDWKRLGLDLDAYHQHSGSCARSHYRCTRIFLEHHQLAHARVSNSLP